MDESNTQTNVNVATATPKSEIIENTTQETVMVQGEEISIQQAIYLESIKTNFYLMLIFTVTVVFFIINKFWSWCRRLFTVNVK